MKGKKRETVGFVRFAITEEERELLQRACALDERCMADFARIYTMRAANVLLGQNNGKNANDIMEQMKQKFFDIFDTLEDEAQDNKPKQAKKKK